MNMAILSILRTMIVLLVLITPVKASTCSTITTIPCLKQTIEMALRNHPELYSESAVNLLLGTAIQESRHGLYLRQFRGGPALGLYQMEPRTFRWLKRKYPEYLDGRYFGELIYDHELSTLAARLRYRVVPEPLPRHADVWALGLYWKKYFNTRSGSGSVRKFVRQYQQLVR